MASLKELGLTLPPRRDELQVLSKEIATDVISQKDGASFGQGVPAFWFARAIEIGGSATNLYQPYADSVWVQAAIKQVTRPISSVDVEVSLPNPSAKIDQRRKMHWKAPNSRPIDSEAIMEWLQEPSPGLTWDDFVQASIGYFKMTECFWLMEGEIVPFPDEKTPLPKLRFARPDRMRPLLDNSRKLIIAWEYQPTNGTPEYYPTDQVIRLFNWNPYHDWRGLGEYQSASIAAESDWLAGKFSRNLMANNGDLGGIIIAKNGVPSDAQREQIVSQLQEKRAAQLRGQLKYVVMTGDVDVKDPKITSVDAPFISQRLENRHEIATAFGVPMSRFDLKASYSIGSASDYYQLIGDTCIPDGSKFCSGVETFFRRVLKRRLEVSLGWDEHPVLQAVRRERLDAADKLWTKGMPMKSVSVYLGLGIEPYEGWDMGYLPINVSPVGSQEMTEPTKPEDYNEPADNPDDEDAGAPDSTKALLALLRSKKTSKAGQGSALSKRLWESHMAKRTASRRMYESKASKVINDYRVTALKKLSAAHAASKAFDAARTKSLIDVIFDPKDFSLSLAKALDPIARTVLQSAGDDVFDEIGRGDDAWTMPPQAVKEFISKRESRIKGVGDTIQSQLKTQLTEAADEGDTMDQITDRVRGVFNNCSKFEARRIAMTEVCAAYGYSRHQAMTDAGIDYKSWLSSHGPNVRPAHAQAEADYSDEPIPIDEPFEVDGEQLMYPGDESGSPENVINCQCIQLAAEKADEGEKSITYKIFGIGKIKFAKP